jgi:hypothetical protein
MTRRTAFLPFLFVVGTLRAAPTDGLVNSSQFPAKSTAQRGRTRSGRGLPEGGGGLAVNVVEC